jgi:small nuclear ribonucleoprotein B and B'
MAQDYGYAPAQGLGRRAPPAPAPAMAPQPGMPPGAPPAAGGAADPRDAITQALMQIQNPPPTLPQQRTMPGAPMPNAPRGMATQPNVPPTGMPPGMMQPPGMPPGVPPGAPGMPPPQGMGLGGAAPGGLVQGELAPTRPNPYA